MTDPQFAYTGASPEQGLVGYVNLTVTAEGVRFIVRSEGLQSVTAMHVVPRKDAIRVLSDALAALTA